MPIRRMLCVFYSISLFVAAQDSPPKPDPEANLRAARVQSLGLFEGADDLDAPTMEEYRAHLAGIDVCGKTGSAQLVSNDAIRAGFKSGVGARGSRYRRGSAADSRPRPRQ
jgi:hypothetical protein